VATIGLVVNTGRHDAATLATGMTAWLEGAGHTVRKAPDVVPVPAGDYGDPTRTGTFSARPAAEFGPGLDVAISLGGDGTILRTIHLLEGRPVPVIGVNFGTLGYLAELDPDALRPALERFLAGDYDVEERMLLDVVVKAPSVGVPEVRTLAFNEAVIEKSVQGRTVRLDVAINGRSFTPYEADGLIVSTPTGSTAYAFSARGPIVAPTHRAILLTPVSPHMLFDRTLVLEPDTCVDVTVASSRRASLTVDGRSTIQLGQGDVVRCVGSEHTARLVTFHPRDFHQILKRKFGLHDR
jgi:NAD+ kinase